MYILLFWFLLRIKFMLFLLLFKIYMFTRPKRQRNYMWWLIIYCNFLFRAAEATLSGVLKLQSLYVVESAYEASKLAEMSSSTAVSPMASAFQGAISVVTEWLRELPEVRPFVLSLCPHQ